MYDVKIKFESEIIESHGYSSLNEICKWIIGEEVTSIFDGKLISMEVIESGK